MKNPLRNALCLSGLLLGFVAGCGSKAPTVNNGTAAIGGSAGAAGVLAGAGGVSGSGAAGTVGVAGSGVAGTLAAGSGGDSGAAGTLAGSGGAGGVSGASGSGAAGSGGAITSPFGAGTWCGPADGATGNFSFFVVSYKAIQKLAELQGLTPVESGIGGDLRYGEADGLTGADKMCREIAEGSMAGAGQKQWHAFLSVQNGPGGSGEVDAIDRIGEGPWYDRIGRMFAMTKTDALAARPASADAAIKDDLPNECGVLNHAPNNETGNTKPDNHDVLTGTGTDGKLWMGDTTDTGSHNCLDWTSRAGSGANGDGRPHCGHSWPRGGGTGMFGGFGGGNAGAQNNWMSALDESGCAPGVNIDPTMDGPPDYNMHTVGSGGGYGAFYCFALTP